MRRLFLMLMAGLFLAGPTMAYEPLVEKKSFEIDTFETRFGKTIKKVRVGWEAYGTLNAAKDNVILITHYFSGNSHAAGRYTNTDLTRGYWDAIIGSGKPLDTDKYYIISVDSLVNASFNDPNVITTGPASINPDTGKPYGMTFPIVTIRDFVEVQRALLDSMGIKKLHAVMGASMGSLQAYEWAAAYPKRVERLIPVIGAGWADANLIAWLNIWVAPIKLDPNWNGGDYYGGKPPLRGVSEALKLITLHANSWEWTNETFGRNWADATKNPGDAMENLFQIEGVLNAVAASRAGLADANHLLYLAKANQLFYAGHGKSLFDGLRSISAPTLIIHTDEDEVFEAEHVRDTAAIIRSNGTPVQIVELQGINGHLDGLFAITQADRQLRAFLNK